MKTVLTLQVGTRATVEQLFAYKGRFPVPKFELPENIYTDDFDVTEAERATKHEYDPTTKQWRRTMINVVIERKPFAEGAMRAAYHMRDLSTIGQQSMYVAKMAKMAGTPVAQYFDDVKMQAEVCPSASYRHAARHDSLISLFQHRRASMHTNSMRGRSPRLWSS